MRRIAMAAAARVNKNKPNDETPLGNSQSPELGSLSPDTSPRQANLDDPMKVEDEKDDEKEEKKTLDQLMEEAINTFSCAQQLERMAYCIIFLAIALLLFGVYEIPFVFAAGSFDESLRTVFVVVGVVFCIIAFIFFTSFVCGFTPGGRKVLFLVTNFVTDNFVSVLLLVVSLMYVPSVRFIVQVYNCSQLTCPTGSLLPFDRSLITKSPTPLSVSVVNNSVQYAAGALVAASNWSAAEWSRMLPYLEDNACTICDPSLVAQGTANVTNTLCAQASTASRLESGRHVDCEMMRLYFWPAGGIMFFAFVLSTPVINFLLTRRSTKELMENFPMDERQTQGYTEDELYEEKVNASDNVAKFIYDPFQLRFKHWRMLFMFQKLFVVVASVFVFRNSGLNTATIGLSLNLIIHTIALGYVLVTTPFSRPVENALTVATQILMVIACACGLPGAEGSPSPAGLLVFIAVLIFVIPVLSLVIGAVLTFQAGLRKEKERAQRIAKAQEEAEEDDDGVDGDESSDGISLENDSFHSGSPAPVSPQMHAPQSPGFAHAVSTSPVTGSPFNAPSDGPNFDSLADIEPPQWMGGLKSNLHTTAARAGQQMATQQPVAKDNQTSFLNPLSHMPRDYNDTSSPQAALLRPGAVPLWALPETERRKLRKSVKKDEASPVTKKYGLAPLAPLTPVDPPPAASPKKKPAPMAPRKRTDGKESVWVKARRLLLEKVRAEREQREREEEEEEERQAQAERERLAKLQGQGGGGPGLQSHESFFLPQGSLADYGDGSVDASDAFTAAPPKKKKKKKFGGGAWGQLLDALRSEDTREKIRQDLEAAEAAEAAGNSPQSPGAANASPQKQIHVGGGRSKKRIEDRLRNRLKAIYQEHLEKIRKRQQTVDFRINVDTMQVLQTFFFIGSLLAVLALLWCGLGIYARRGVTTATTFMYVQENPGFPEPIDYAYVGYQSWEEFTSNCVCLPFTEQKESYPFYASEVEQWICQNGRVKERIRRRSLEDPDLGVFNMDSYAMRPLCGLRFGMNCTMRRNTPRHDNPQVTVDVTGCNWDLVFNNSLPSGVIPALSLNTSDIDYTIPAHKAMSHMW